jgi:hypothetical protein
MCNHHRKRRDHINIVIYPQSLHAVIAVPDFRMFFGVMYRLLLIFVAITTLH